MRVVSPWVQLPSDCLTPGPLPPRGPVPEEGPLREVLLEDIALMYNHPPKCHIPSSSGNNWLVHGRKVLYPNNLYASPLCPLLSQVILTPPEAPNLKSEELNVEPGLGRPLPPEVKVEGPKEELKTGGEAGFAPETIKGEPEVPPTEGLLARLPAVLTESTAQVGTLSASTTEIAQPQKGRKPRDLELPLSPSLLGGPGPERTPGSGTGSGLQAPGPALTPSLLPTHTLVSAYEGCGWQPE
jgi:hypothetical protein